jgi:acetyl-CoA carboxylase carboxyltransferase component
MVKQKKASGISKEAVTKEDMKKFEEEIIHEFHIISEGLIDQIKLLAEGHSGIIDRLDRMEKENERQHSETRAFLPVGGLIEKRLQ